MRRLRRATSATGAGCSISIGGRCENSTVLAQAVEGQLVRAQEALASAVDHAASKAQDAVNDAIAHERAKLDTALGSAQQTSEFQMVGDRYFFDALNSDGSTVRTSIVTASLTSEDPPVRLVNHEAQQLTWVGTAKALFWTDGYEIYSIPVERQ